KFTRPGSVVATLLKLGNETPPPLDYDLATGGHPAEVKSAEAVFRTMLKTQEVMAQTYQLLTKVGAELQPGLGAESRLASQVGPPQPDADGRPRSHWNSDLAAWTEETRHILNSQGCS